MVGDDLWNDVLGAQRAGLRAIFVRSGKHGDAELAEAARRTRRRRPPDVVADDLGAVVTAVVARHGWRGRGLTSVDGPSHRTGDDRLAPPTHS